jgi:hypothetical protein
MTTAETATFASKAASAAQYGGPAITIGSATKQYFGYSLDEWSLIGIFVGIVVGVVGLISSQAMNFYFKHQHLQIARQKSRADENE